MNKNCTQGRWRKGALTLSAASAALALLATPASYDGLRSVTDPNDPTNGGFWDISGSEGIAVDVEPAVSTAPFVSICQIAAPILTEIGFFETSHFYRGESPAIGVNTRPWSGFGILIK